MSSVNMKLHGIRLLLLFPDITWSVTIRTMFHSMPIKKVSTVDDILEKKKSQTQNLRVVAGRGYENKVQGVARQPQW